VIFTEIDFDTLDEKTIRRILVGATRTTMKLTLIVPETAAQVLLDRLGSREPLLSVSPSTFR
jgi:hypothetical protein